MAEVAHSLERFINAQGPIYDTALAEIRRGDKRSHWMWFIFPQLVQLGRSPIAKFYGVDDGGEARAYLDHPLLGARFRECVQALQDLDTSDPVKVFGQSTRSSCDRRLPCLKQCAPTPCSLRPSSAGLTEYAIQKPCAF